MAAEAFAEHLQHPVGRGHAPAGASVGAAGGAACGDVVRVSVVVRGERVHDVGFDASGCGATVAAGSAAVALVRGAPLLEAARVGTAGIAAELGGLSPGKLHAAELAADALHRALGAAARGQARLAPVPERVLVAMSGGVDSAVAALLCARSGSQPMAVTLELWSDPEHDSSGSCCSADAVRLARSVAHSMGLPHFTLDLRPEFRAGVVDPFLSGHAQGQTPNPCVACNGHVRLDAMLAFAESLGARELATGHYARVHDGLLRTAADPAKDQTYMLSALGRTAVGRMRFPLGALHKAHVRELAREAGLPVAGRADSQDLCFLAGSGGKAAFLARHGGLAERDGELVDRSGRVLGRHRGHHRFTVGQRRGLGLSGGEPLYVLATDARANRVTVGPHDELRTSHVVIRGARLHEQAERVDRVRLRYHARPLPCRIRGQAGPGPHRRLELELGEAADGATPGQTACLMGGDVVLGWGTVA